MDKLNLLFYVAVCFALIAWGIEQLRKMFLTTTVAVSRMTQDGEQVSIHVNFSMFDSYEKKREKLFELAQLGDDRLEFCDARFKAQLEEKAKQKAQG